MSQRLNAYFVKEAREYLEQIEEVLSASREVEGERLVRLARGVRGSAQMAGAGGLAPVTERLETVLRSVHTQLLEWSDDVRDLVLHSVSELQSLLGSLEQWGDEERERVRVLLERWDTSDRTALQGVEQGSGVVSDVSGGRGDPAGHDPSAGESTGANREGLRTAGEGAAPAAVNGGTRLAVVHEDQVVPISALFFDDAGPHVIAPDGAAPVEPPLGSDGVVPIETLLLRGPAAARAALALRPRLDRMLASGAAADDLGVVHDELFDLLELSISEATA
jgi:HPt (histidine-containing phosphotransfer) domain-containing protein